MNHVSRDLTFERTAFFSDAVFAIAITLLILDVRLPAGELPIGDALAATAPKIFGFLLSFMVIGIYWLNHNRLFARLSNVSPAIVRLNLFLLLTVSFLPFPTSVLAELGPKTAVVTLYALSVAALGLMHFIIASVALRPPTMREGLTQLERNQIVARSLVVPVVFAATAIVAQTRPDMAMQFWLLIPPGLWAMAPLLQFIHNRRLPKEPAT